MNKPPAAPPLPGCQACSLAARAPQNWFADAELCCLHVEQGSLLAGAACGLSLSHTPLLLSILPHLCREDVTAQRLLQIVDLVVDASVTHGSTCVVPQGLFVTAINDLCRG